MELMARNGSPFPLPMSQALRQVVCSFQAVHTSAHLNQRVKVGCSWQWEERPRQVGSSSRGQWQGWLRTLETQALVHRSLVCDRVALA